jgi:ATP-binding protein involved in chromosome partitioning
MPGVAADTTVVAVLSGKGGVGKSTVSLNLALALAQSGRRVGLLDADLYGPDIPLMLNLTRTAPRKEWLLGRAAGFGSVTLVPVERYGLRVMSVGFLLGEEQGLTLRAPLLAGAIHQLTHGVEWGDVELLVVDLPPGTADLSQEIFRSLDVAGAIVVVGPQDVAHLDGRKVVDMLRAVHVRILGGVENMAAFACPHCSATIDLFPSTTDERSIWARDVERLASIPLAPELAVAGDRGRPVFVDDPEGAQAAGFRVLADRLETALAAG